MGTFAQDSAFDAVNVFLDTDGGFAVEATTSGASTIAGIFSNDYFASNPGGRVEVASSEPVFRTASTLATGLARGSLLTIEGLQYSVLVAQPNARGFTDFRLHLT